MAKVRDYIEARQKKNQWNFMSKAALFAGGVMLPVGMYLTGQQIVDNANGVLHNEYISTESQNEHDQLMDHLNDIKPGAELMALGVLGLAGAAYAGRLSEEYAKIERREEKRSFY